MVEPGGSRAAMTAEIRVRRLEANGIHLNVAEAGPEDGPLLLLLHGFPESWYGWRHQIDPLAAAGFRVVAPDQRGYGGEREAAGVASYRLDNLVADVVGLLASLGRERARSSATTGAGSSPGRRSSGIPTGSTAR